MLILSPLLLLGVIQILIPGSQTHSGAFVFVHPPEMSCKSAGGAWTRPSGDVSNSVQGVADCAAKCAGYTYFGLECPRGTVHCQCANTLSGSTSADDCDRQRDHCIGPFTQGGYMMGGADRGSVYLVKPSAGDVTVVIAGKSLWFSTEKASWNAAFEKCKSQHGQLVVLDNHQAQQAFHTYVAREFHDERFWLGGSDIYKEGSWTWINYQSFYFFRWGPGQPDNHGNDEDCLEWGFGNNYNDEPCHKQQRYVCELH